MMNFKNYVLANVYTPSYEDHETPFGTSKGEGNMMDDLTSWVDGLIPIFDVLLPTLFTILFLSGIIKMSYSILTKTGHILKGSTSVMIFVPVVYFMIRVVSVFMFTTKNISVTLIVTDIMIFLQNTGILISTGVIIISLLFYFKYKLLKHPEFGKWSKRLVIGSSFLIILVNIIPFIMGV